MAAPVMPYNFLTITGTIVAEQFGYNFAELANKLGGNVYGVDLANDAGIRANQIADRYVIMPPVDRVLIAPCADAIWDNSPTVTTISATAMQRAARAIVRGIPGQLLYLCSIIASCDTLTATDSFPRVQVYKNGTLITNATFDLATGHNTTAFPGDFYQQQNSDPYRNRLMAFVDGDYIEYRLGQSGTSNPTCRSLMVREYWLSQLTS
ncbi:hypothetical protein [Bacteriophage sp.]|nr:hypothetical protein [Bacteriophage sp.]UOF80124.1 hypothetical protein [Bacteriophage sp.]